FKQKGLASVGQNKHKLALSNTKVVFLNERPRLRPDKGVTNTCEVEAFLIHSDSALLVARLETKVLRFLHISGQERGTNEQTQETLVLHNYSLTPEHVMHCNIEDYSRLVKSLPETEAALSAWAIILMAYVVKYEFENKMNARNIDMVFAPIMT
ncbi:Rho GTPase-activating protein domain-containing protein, partial [Cynara cardunculus var. scolymus]